MNGKIHLRRQNLSILSGRLIVVKAPIEHMVSEALSNIVVKSGDTILFFPH